MSVHVASNIKVKKLPSKAGTKRSQRSRSMPKTLVMNACAERNRTEGTSVRDSEQCSSVVQELRHGRRLAHREDEWGRLGIDVANTGTP